MIDFVTHPVNQRRLHTLKNTLPGSLLLAGERGVGLFTTAKRLGGTFVTDELFPKDANGETDSGGSISVEAIRSLYEHTRAKRDTPQVIIIDDADRMSPSAQGAFLKLLEEPGNKIHFILTSHIPDILLSTIRSRVQQLFLKPATHAQTLDYLIRAGITDKATQDKLLFIADGLPAEITRLVSDESYFKKRAAIMVDARSALATDAYQKLLVLQCYQSDRAAALELVEAMLLIARRSLSRKPQARLIHELDKLLDIREKLAANHNVRLQLMRYVL